MKEQQDSLIPYDDWINRQSDVNSDGKPDDNNSNNDEKSNKRKLSDCT